MNNIDKKLEKFRKIIETKKNNDGIDLCDLEYIRRLHDSGLVVLPITANQDKVQRNKYPRDAEGNYKKDADGIFEGFSWELLEHEFSHYESGIGILCGKDGLEILDIENEELYQDFRDEFFEESIIEELPVVRTPRPGFHVYWKCGVYPSQKLAMDESGKQVLIETRGRGNYGVSPGSSVNCHKLVKPYTLEQGDLTEIPVIEEELRDRIIAWARSCSKYVNPVTADFPTDRGDTPLNDDPTLPSNVFGSKVSWETLLTTFGWRLESGGTVKSWIRPGKITGSSATTGYEGRDKLHVFTSSLPHLEPGKEYSKAQFLCRSQFAGNWKATLAYICENYLIDPSLLNLTPDTYEWEPRNKSEIKSEIKVDLEKSPENTPKLKKAFFNLSEIKTMNTPLYLVKHHINLNSICVIFGPSGSFKSFYAIKLALAVASGTPFLERFKTKKKPIAYVYSEGTEGAKLRFLTAIKDSGITVSDDSVSIFPTSYHFTEEEEVRRFIEHWEGMKEKPSAIVIDTLNRNYGGDENSTKDMTKFVANIDNLRRLTGAAILVIHHMGKDESKGARGSNVLRAAADTEIMVNLNGEFVGITCTKQKDIAPFKSYACKVRVVDSDYKDEDGDILTTCVLDYAGDLAEIQNTATVKKDEIKAKTRFQQIGLFMNSEDWITIAELADLSKLKYDYIYDTLKEGRKLGWVECEKRNRTFIYKLTESGNSSLLVC